MDTIGKKHGGVLKMSQTAGLSRAATHKITEHLVSATQKTVY